MEKVNLCIAKIGQPDLENGMRTCRAPVVWANAGDLVRGEPVTYTGWRHAEAGPFDHGGVPESWL